MHLIVILILTIIYLTKASEPVVVEADTLERDKDGVITASGNVKVMYEGKVIETQKIIYDTNNKRIDIPVNFYIKTESFEGTASDGWWDIENDQGQANNFQGLMNKTFYVKGKLILKKKDEYDFKNLEFSTCPFDQRDWYIKTSSGNAKENDKINFFNMSLRFCKVPVLYTPYFSYPLTDRKTGFLPPTVGKDTYNTLILKVPFFYVINDYSDMTITADYRNNQGKGVSTEYRRMFDEKSYLNLQLDFFKEDSDIVLWQNRTQTPLKNRWRLKLDSNYSPFESWKFFSKVDLPSDRYFFEDFYNTTMLRYLSFTRSYVVGRRDFGNYLAEINFDYFYDLSKPDNRYTIQRFPELRIYKKPENFIFKNLYYDILSDTTYFYSESSDAGIRTDNIVNFYQYSSIGKFLNIAQFMPRLTLYINTKNNNTFDSRFLLPFKDTLQTNIVKPYGSFVHSVIPKISFEYVSKVNQSNLPFYDRDDRVDEKKDIDISLYNILNFKSNLYFRWEISSGYTFLGHYKIGENVYSSNIKPVKNGLLFNVGKISADSISYFDMEKGVLLRTISSFSVFPKNWLSYSLSYVYDSKSSNSKQLSNSISLTYDNFKLSAYMLNNLSGGYVQRKNFSLLFDRKCWNLALNVYEDYNASTQKRFRSIFVILNIMNIGYKLPFIRN